MISVLLMLVDFAEKHAKCVSNDDDAIHNLHVFGPLMQPPTSAYFVQFSNNPHIETLTS